MKRTLPALFLALAASAAWPQANELRLFNWTDYIASRKDP